MFQTEQVLSISEGSNSLCKYFSCLDFIEGFQTGPLHVALTALMASSALAHGASDLIYNPELTSQTPSIPDHTQKRHLASASMLGSQLPTIKKKKADRKDKNGPSRKRKLSDLGLDPPLKKHHQSELEQVTVIPSFPLLHSPIND